MSTTIRRLVIDCADTFALATFWSAALGRPMNDDVPGDQECAVHLPEGNQPPRILFIKVPEEEAVKNRLHIDVHPEDRTLVEEVERLVGLGAVVIADRRSARGLGWFVMNDPAGNEFCVESSEAEISRTRAATAEPQDLRGALGDPGACLLAVLGHDRRPILSVASPRGQDTVS